MKMKEIGRSARISLMVVVAFGGWVASVCEASQISLPPFYVSDGQVYDPNHLISYEGQPPTNFSQETGAGLIGALVDPVPLPDGTTLTYSHVLFKIWLGFIDGTGAPGVSFEIDGELNGTITGNTKSTLVPSITSVHQISGPPVPLGALTITTRQSPMSLPSILISGGEEHIYPSGIGLYSSYNPSFSSPIPEPNSLGLYAVAFGGLAIWRLRRKGLRFVAA